MVSDALGGYARKGMAENWCILYEFPNDMRFNYARYSEHGVDMLATKFCLRGDFFFKLWLENNVKGQTFRYSLGGFVFLCGKHTIH